jgi:hypothetical protein
MTGTDRDTISRSMRYGDHDQATFFGMKRGKQCLEKRGESR